MNRPRRGDVFVANISGERVPVVVVSRDSINEASPIILIVPAVPRAQLQMIGYGHLVVVPPGSIAIEGEWVFISTHVRSLHLEQLTTSVGALSPRLMSKIDNALRTVLGLN